MLSRYVAKYFYDMWGHVQQLFGIVRSQGRINYIVGNSKFYSVVLPVEQYFVSMFAKAGFESVHVKTLRKRNSKKELFEFLVTGGKP